MKGIASSFEAGRSRFRRGIRKPSADDPHSSAGPQPPLPDPQPSLPGPQTPLPGPQLPPPGPHHTWMAIMLVVLVGRVEEWVPGLVNLPLAKVAFLLTVFYAYRDRRMLLPVRLASLRIARPCFAFFTLAIFSIIFSIYRSATLAWIQTTVILLITIVVLLKITQTLPQVERLILALAASAILLSLGVVLNYKGGRAHINGNFDPNDVAYSLDTILPIVMAVGAAHSKRLKWAAYGVAVIIACAILLTGSLGGAIGFGVVVLAMIVYPISATARGELKRFALIGAISKVALIVMLGAATWNYLPTATRDRLTGLGDLQNNYNAGESKTSRLVIWRTQITLAVERPIGYGMGTAAAADGRLGGGAYFTSHNSSVEAFIELGVLGLGLFWYTYYISWRELGTVLRKPPPCLADREGLKALLYARGLRVALIGNFAAGFFLSEAYSSTMWMTVAVCAAFVRVVSNEQGIVTPQPFAPEKKWRATKRAPRMTHPDRIGGPDER